MPHVGHMQTRRPRIAQSKSQCGISVPYDTPRQKRSAAALDGERVARLLAEGEGADGRGPLECIAAV